GDGLFRRGHGDHGAGLQRRSESQRRAARAGRARRPAGSGGVAGLSVRPAARWLSVRHRAGAAVLGRGAGAAAADSIHLAAAALTAAASSAATMTTRPALPIVGAIAPTTGNC